MKVKEKISHLNTILSDRKSLAFLTKIILSFSGGIICSVPYFLGSFSPFAAALPAALNGMFSITCAIGSILGIFVFQSGISAFRYFATVLTSTAILHICLYYLGLKKEKLLRPICPGLCAGIVNFIFLFSQKFSADLIFTTVVETVLTIVAVPVFSVAIKEIYEKRFLSQTSGEKHTAIAILALSFLIGQLRGTGVIGEFFAILIFWCGILYFSFKKSFFASAVTSVCAAVSLAMGGEADFMCAAIALGGCICPLINTRYRYTSGIVIIALTVTGCAFGEYTDFFPTLPATILSAATMSVIPSKIFQNRLNSDPHTIADNVAIPIQAKEISAAVENLGDCMNAVRKTLRPFVTAELTQVLFNAGKKICEKCELQDSCINSIRKENNPCYKKIASALNENRLDYSSFPENFKNTCYLSEQMLNSMRQAYFVYCTNINSDNKISRFQEITGNQLKSIGSIIGPICATAMNAGAITAKNSRACAVCAEEFGIDIISAHLCQNKAGHEYFNLSFKKPDNNFNVTKLTENLRRETGFELDFPTLIQKDDVYTLIFKQKPKISFKISAAVKPATPDGVSGDYYRSFKDSFSRQVVLLSDGMGTGTRAAVDSAFTCETFCNLLKSGLDVKTAAAAVNCAMLMKSTDESLATVDLIIADPVAANLTIYKCGAAPSFILKNGKVSVLEAESAPIGILDKVDMAKSEISISKGDIYLTVSDGITGDSWGWISAELKTYAAQSPTDLAKHILQCACDRMIGKRADDMTVIALMADNP
ncbi:MAG: SpoIIE family protein phosphatase [Clostridia bacterium]|nr:SpoIIE family protein phosphatase [Clostridia bacterium]